MKPIRKGNKRAGKALYSNLRLADGEGGEYSATPGDYFMMRDDQKFQGNALVVTERRGAWSRTKVLKSNPTLGDVKKWYRKVEPHGI
jgi:hypothetical protein